MRGAPVELPTVRHLIVSLGARYDLADRDTPYSLDHLAFNLRPPAGLGYPFSMSALWLFARLEGEGTHELWAEVYRLGEAEGELLAAWGPYVVPFGPDVRHLSRAWRLRGVPFFTPGWYAFRLTAGGGLLATESVYLEE